VKTIKIKVLGKVQGVFFRQSAKETAVKLGVKGIVKNCDDDSVEVVATGDEQQLEKFIAWCRQGPPNAFVSEVLVQELSLQEFRNFSIHHF
jgi:acylphosphatase